MIRFMPKKGGYYKILALMFACIFAFIFIPVHAEGEVVDVVNVIVDVSCSLEGTGMNSHTASMMPDTVNSSIGETTLKAYCNDPDGFSIYAIGYTGDTDGQNWLAPNTIDPSNRINTGTGTSGNSQWAMKLSTVSSPTPTYPISIENNFNNFHNVPSTYARVAMRASGTDVGVSAEGSTLKTTYQAYVSGVQPADTYVGKVKYVLIHPSTDCIGYTVAFNAGTGSGTMADQVICTGISTQLSTNTLTPPTGYQFQEWNTEPDGTGVSYDDEEYVTDITSANSTITLYAIWYRPAINLYSTIASMTKGTQTLANLQSTISTSNSGVYTYNSSVFGADTDGTKSDNTKATIYYYRGILDSSFGSSTYGSSGDGTLSPNYVILSPTGTKSTSDTCWRIIRTTGSGGIKMIYNGKWTGSTCANAQGNASTGTGAFNTGSGSNPVRRIALSGYTYNNTYGTSTSTTSTSVSSIFGTNTSFSNNTTSSTVKNNIDTWYNSNLSSYTNILEPNAGYCNDRTFYSDNTGNTVATSLRPSGSNNSTGTNAYSAGYFRNSYNSSSKPPSLRCSRDTADVYSTSTASGGNGQLSRPIALITADELSFAGAGAQTANQGSAYTASSFVRSGSDFWTMTPYNRTTSSSRATFNYRLSSNGYLSSGQITTTTYTIRPVISLKEGTEAIGGTGTATDPWVVTAP